MNRPALRYVDRWNVQLLEELRFEGRTVPLNFTSDLASIRPLREVCRYAALAAVLAGFAAYGWLAQAFFLVAVAALAVYGLLAGYGMRAAIIHDWLYDRAEVSRKEADGVFYRALRADGVARWRAYIFYIGVRCFGFTSYGKGTEK